jgi:hypothetical protein
LLNLATSLSSTEQGNPVVRIKHKEVLLTLEAAQTGTNGAEGVGNVSLKISNFVWIPNQSREKNQGF